MVAVAVAAAAAAQRRMAHSAASKVEEDDAGAVEWVAGRTGWRREGGRGPREKDIKVRNSQRGERAPPRHRLDRGSLIPLLECSPPPPPPRPPPSATHPPAIRLPLPPSPLHTGVPTTTHLHLLRRTGEPPSTCSTYTLARLCQFLSCCRRCHCRHRCEEERGRARERESGKERRRGDDE